MTVQVNRRFDIFFQGLDNGIGVIGGDQSRHVFDTDAVRAHGLEVFGLVDKIIDVVNLAAHPRFGHGIADAALKMLAALFDDRHHRLEIAVVIQGIEGPEYIHPVLGGSFNKCTGHVIGVISIAHQVLSPQEH